MSGSSWKSSRRTGAVGNGHVLRGVALSSSKITFAGILREARSAEASIDEVPIAVVLSENKRPPLPGVRDVPADHELFAMPDWDFEPVGCSEARAVDTRLRRRWLGGAR